MTPRSISARVSRCASGWRIATWSPRRSASRGLPTEQPSAASRAVDELDRELGQRHALRPDRGDARLGDEPDALFDRGDRDDAGVPVSHRPMPGAGS